MNPFFYKGSGTYWLRHLEKYGYQVETLSVWSYYDLDECKEVALRFSSENRIVESDDWANLMPETGIGIPYNSISHKSLEFRDKISKCNKGRKRTAEQNKRNSEIRKQEFSTWRSSPMKGKKHKQETIQLYSEQRRGKKNSESHNSAIARAMSTPEVREKLRRAALRRWHG